MKSWYYIFLLINHTYSFYVLHVDYRLMNEFIEAIGEFKMKAQRIYNLTSVSITVNFVLKMYEIDDEFRYCLLL